jgi:hypothetical protein
MYKIVKKKVLNPTVTWIEIEATLVVRKGASGTFGRSRTCHGGRT